MVVKLYNGIINYIEKLTGGVLNHQNISYIIFGVLTTAVDWIAFKSFRYMGFGKTYATVISQVSAVLFAYITNRIIVFKSGNKGIAAVIIEFFNFVVARLFTSLINIVGMYIFSERLTFNENIVKGVLSIAVILLNYLLSKIFVFKKRRESDIDETENLV